MSSQAQADMSALGNINQNIMQGEPQREKYNLKSKEKDRPSVLNIVSLFGCEVESATRMLLPKVFIKHFNKKVKVL